MWEKATEGDHIRAYRWLSGWTLSSILNKRANVVDVRVAPAVTRERVLVRGPGTAERDRLRTAGGVVGNRKRPAHSAGSARRESDIDRATRPRCEVRAAASVGLAEVGGHGDARDGERRCAVIAERE